MTVRRILRYVGVGVIITGLALAIAVVMLPAGWTQVRLERMGWIGYLQADRGALAMGEIDGTPPVAPSAVPTPRRANGVGDFLSGQFENRAQRVFASGMRRYRGGDFRHSVLGVELSRSTVGNAVFNWPPIWWQRELRLPAWLLALPGMIWLSIRLRRKIVNRSRPTGFDVLPAGCGD